MNLLITIINTHLSHSRVTKWKKWRLLKFLHPFLHRLRIVSNSKKLLQVFTWTIFADIFAFPFGFFSSFWSNLYDRNFYLCECDVKTANDHMNLLIFCIVSGYFHNFDQIYVIEFVICVNSVWNVRMVICIGNVCVIDFDFDWDRDRWFRSRSGMGIWFWLSTLIGFNSLFGMLLQISSIISASRISLTWYSNQG